MKITSWASWSHVLPGDILCKMTNGYHPLEFNPDHYYKEKEIMKELTAPVSRLMTDIQGLQSKITEKNDALEAMRTICEHEWENKGIDGKMTTYECSICKKVDKW